MSIPRPLSTHQRRRHALRHEHARHLGQCALKRHTEAHRLRGDLLPQVPQRRILEIVGGDGGARVARVFDRKQGNLAQNLAKEMK